MVLLLFRPADEEGAVAVEPGVAGLDDPTPRAPAGGATLELDLFAAAADVRREAAFADQRTHALVVVAAIETETLRPLPARRRPLDRDRVERGR
jgi:hypothetical protein